MEVILLERVGRLGQMGEVVRVKNGFARNFLLPKGKALRATKDNRAKFESMKSQLEAQNLEQKSEATSIAAKVEGKTIVVLRQAAESGQLFGSVSARDVAALLTKDGVTINRSQVSMNAPIKTVGRYVVPVALHPEVEVSINVHVARNEEEAERLARGEDITVSREAADDAEVAAAAAAELFEKPEEADRAAGGDADENDEAAEKA